MKGAGYRGRFGGEGWDGMWTDMSEIVRPTRDGIHGREFISTSVDIGQKPPFLSFDGQGLVTGESARAFSLPIPIVLDVPASSVQSPKLLRVLVDAAQSAETLVVLPITLLKEFRLEGEDRSVGSAGFRSLREGLGFAPSMIELEGWNETLFREVQKRFAESAVCLREDFTSPEELLKRYRSGVRVFHLAADYHGRGPDGRFVLELICEAHDVFVQAGCR